MAVDFNTMSLVSMPLVRFVFEQIVENRSLRFGELVKRIESRIEPDNARDQARDSVRKLVEADLVGEKGSALEDFTVYYVKAKGLEASRKAST